MVSGLFQDIDKLLLCVAGFFSFSLLTSATYIVNDLLDLNLDRQHPRKRFRPLAQGSIPPQHALIIACLLALSGLCIALILSAAFSIVLFLYLLVSLLYSLKIKTYMAIDIIILTLLYLLRIISGAVLIQVPVSFWLMSFSIFVFLSLALIKRCAEIKLLKNTDKDKLPGRAYRTKDYPVLEGFGVFSAMIAVTTFCFFIENGLIVDMYQSPMALWLIVPFLGYWFIRVWIMTHQGKMHDDPIVYTIKDMPSLVCISFCCLTAILAQLI